MHGIWHNDCINQESKTGERCSYEWIAVTGVAGDQLLNPVEFHGGMSIKVDSQNNGM